MLPFFSNPQSYSNNQQNCVPTTIPWQHNRVVWSDASNPSEEREIDDHIRRPVS
jgi:hypothetical protein